MTPRQAVIALALGTALLAVSCSAAAPHPGAGGTGAGGIGTGAGSAVPAVPTATVPAPQTPSLPTASQLLGGADPTDATAVGAAFARASWTIDATVDRSEVDAEARAVALMTPALAALVGEGLATVEPTADFDQWRLHRAVTTAAVTQTHDAGAPPDTPTTAKRSFAIVVTPVGTDGWRGPNFTTVEFIALTRLGPGDPWQVADLE